MKLTARDRALLGVLVALLLCGAFYKLLLLPERHRAGALASQITVAQTALAKAQQKDLTGHAAEIALRRDQPDWTAAQRAVPGTADVPGLLKLLARTARSAHVTMQSITLSGSPTTATASTTATATGAPGLTSIPVALTFSGGYQALNRLVSHLDALVTVSHRRIHSTGPLVGISSVDVTPQTGTSGSSSLAVALTATIYQRAAATAATSAGATG